SLRCRYTTYDCQKLVRISLAIHKHFIKPKLRQWSNSVREEILSDAERIKLTTLHTGETIEELGQREGLELLEALAELHVKYCTLQNKTHAICVHSFKNRRPGHKRPQISVEYTQSRWGLFGYRFEAALTLKHSRKYI